MLANTGQTPAKQENQRGRAPDQGRSLALTLQNRREHGKAVAIARKLRPMKRHPTKKDAIAALKKLGVPVGAVLDVGVQHGTRALMEGYRDVPHLLMEPIAEFAETIRAHYGKAKIPYTLIEAAISDEDGHCDLVTRSLSGDDTISHAQSPSHAQNGAGAPSALENASGARTVPARRLDTVMADHAHAAGISAPYFLKIDIDGDELRVLKGAHDTLSQCSVVCMEAVVTNFLERASAVCAAGFQLFDIVDICYYNGRLYQFDLIFLSYKTIAEKNIRLVEGGFDMSAWAPYRH